MHAKNTCWLAALALCIGLIAVPAFAGEPELGPTPRFSVEVPGLATGSYDFPQDKQVDMSNLSYELDGKFYNHEEIGAMFDASEIHIVIDLESTRTGIAKVFRTLAEADAHVAKAFPGGLDNGEGLTSFHGKSVTNCSAKGDVGAASPSACRAFGSFNCVGSTLTNPCGFCTTITSGTVRSVEIGCNRSFFCSSFNCSTGCTTIFGQNGCFNLTSGVVNSFGCTVN